MINLFGIIFLILICIVILYFAIRIFVYWWRWNKLCRVALYIKIKHLNEILDEIENIGTQTSNALMLVKQPDLCTDERYGLTISEKIDSIWSGKSVIFKIVEDIEPLIVDGSGVNQLGKHKFRPVLVPRIKLKNDKEQNIWAENKYIQSSAKIRHLMSEIPENYQAEMLAKVIGSTVLIGGGLSWIQNPEFPNCSICNKRMTFILQLSGYWFPKNVEFDVGCAEIYLFGCKDHPDVIQKVIQFD
jgi:hypothetical protein